MIVRKNLVKVTARRVYADMGTPPQVMFHNISEYCNLHSIHISFERGVQHPVASRVRNCYFLKLPCNIYRTYYAAIGLGYVLLGYGEGFLRRCLPQCSDTAQQEANLFAREILLVHSYLIADLFFAGQESFRKQARVAEIPDKWVESELGAEIERLEKIGFAEKLYKSQK